MGAGEESQLVLAEVDLDVEKGLAESSDLSFALD